MIRQVTDRDVTDAISVLTADYLGDVLSVAKDLARAMKAGEVSEFSDALHEAVDSTQRVIYTFRARCGLLVSDNADAYAEEFGDDSTASVEAQMHAAMSQDVAECLGRCGVDVNDESSWSEIDLGEFES